MSGSTGIREFPCTAQCLLRHIRRSSDMCLSGDSRPHSSILRGFYSTHRCHNRSRPSGRSWPRPRVLRATNVLPEVVSKAVATADGPASVRNALPRAAAHFVRFAALLLATTDLALGAEMGLVHRVLRATNVLPEVVSQAVQQPMVPPLSGMHCPCRSTPRPLCSTAAGHSSPGRRAYVPARGRLLQATGLPVRM